MDILVAEQALQPVHRQTRLKLMGGVGVAQAVDAADLLDTGASLGRLKAFLRTGDT